MKQISQFFTLYWCIYFPTCIAYNSLPGFSSIDEIMTIVLFLYTFMSFGKKGTNKKPVKEYYLFIAIACFFTIYSLLFGVNVPDAVWLDFIQQVRPFTIIYCTWILNPQFSKGQKKIMLTVMVVTLFSWIAYHPATMDFNSQSEFVVLGQMAICTAMSWYIFTKQTKRNRYIALIIVFVGLLAPKFKYLGEVVVFVYIFMFMKGRFNFKSPKTISALIMVLIVIIAVTWTKFDSYYVSGMNNDQLARPMTYKTAWKILWDYIPFGPGMGSFAALGAMKHYSPLYYKYNLEHIWGLTPNGTFFVADTFYPCLAQFGILGVILFFSFWKRRLNEFARIADMRYYRVAYMSFFCLAIEQTADSSWLSGKGMGFCMLIALCLCYNNANYSTQEQAISG